MIAYPLSRPIDVCMFMWQDYVVIDDRSLLKEAGGEFMVGHFVQTRLVKGLTKVMGFKTLPVKM